MSSCSNGTREGGMMLRSSVGGRQTCILMQRGLTAANGNHLPEPSRGNSLHEGPLFKEAEAGEDESGFLPIITSQALLCRGVLVIGLSLTLFVVGTLLFIRGFFLSKDDLPYISSGRAIPFPPLFPHLDPAQLQLNTEEGVYYVDGSSPRAGRRKGEHVDADGDSRPLLLEQFTDPQLVPVSADPEPCQTQPCQSSWISVTPYHRVIVFLIDAMRFDFLLWDPEASNDCESDATKECTGAPFGLRPFYRNRMPFAHDLLRRSDADLQRFLHSLVEGREAQGQGNSSGTVQENRIAPEAKLQAGASVPQESSAALPSSNSWGGNRFTRLYIFEADPPTATTQRLTGLATGSMPSFFSVRETFSASAVNVDSLLQQLKAANKTSVAIGDDTWDRSFGHLLTRVHAFPSLNIQDLHTVDDGVSSQLPREIAKGDWTFLVGHVLGVDHVGHASVLDSNLMHKKLTEMNDMIKTTLKLILKHDFAGSTVSTRPTRTLFLVFGDHGMTEGGSHGGGSSEEVGRTPTYLQNHGALRDSIGRRKVGSGSSLDAASPTAALGYGARRVRQVGLAPTLSLLLGLPIPFNSMGRIIADLVPSVASFVEECAQGAQGKSLRAFKCGANDGKPCRVRDGEDLATARAVRCSDLVYLTQLHHIAAWQQHRAIMTHAALTGNGAVLTDPQFAASKAKWLRLYSELDKEIKSLPPAAHEPLTSGSSAPTFGLAESNSTLSLSNAGIEAADSELISRISQLSGPADGGDSGKEGDAHLGTTKEAATGAASALPSLIPYLRASADFSQEAWQASVRQLCTFNIMFMLCGISMVFCSVVILVLSFWALHIPFSAGANPTNESHTPCSLPELATIARWLCYSACIGGGIWAVGWAFLETLSNHLADPAPALEAFVWRQLPVLSLTGALCSVVVPFARSILTLYPRISAQRGLLRGSRQGEDEPLVSGKPAAWGLAKLLQQKLCVSQLWIRFFSGGRFHCYVSLLVLCIIPFNDCLVERECSIVKFLISIYCISAGLTAFATPSPRREKKQIVSACAGLALCVRIGSAFDPFADSLAEAGSNSWPLQIDSTSASAFLMFCIYCIVGMEELPLVSRLFGREKDDDHCCESEENSRFRVAGFHPLRGRKGARSCTFERGIFLAQGAIAVLWFAFPHDSKPQQSASQVSQQPQERYDTPLHDALALLWSVIVLPFKVLDNVGGAVFGWLTASRPWLFTAPHCVLRVIPSQLLDGGNVKLVPLLKVLLPWVIYLLTAGLWMRLVLILCRMKKRENDFSRQQLHSAKAESTALEMELKACAHADGPTQQALQTKESVLTLWSIIELWEYFSHYFFFAAICPLCMFAVLLGRVQLWPLLLCCMKWRLLVFLGRVLVVKTGGPIGQKCSCSFCFATPAISAPTVTDATGYRHGSASARGDSRRPKHGMQFFLSDGSLYMMAALLALDTFFVTGHRTKLSALPIEAGFVGLLEFHPVWSFVLSFLHTYAVYVVCCPLVFMLAFLRTAHAAKDKTAPIAQSLQRSTASAVVQTTSLIVGKVAFG
ncbi:hypothetical protein, conserved [Eimeria praecox]|uniref:GPI ethanolamine phosphate transferase 3 n=1 Tax=Eimeria praecox TaxID=51316 RepID=U6G0M0_9EIME|nr:hypothetical protein, conserved [Eimeria praecox]